MFTQDQILGFVRHALTLAGGALITGGIFSEAELMEAIGALSTVLGFVWSWRQKRNIVEIKQS
jgi:hypothetical protein